MMREVQQSRHHLPTLQLSPFGPPPRRRRSERRPDCGGTPTVAAAAEKAVAGGVTKTPHTATSMTARRKGGPALRRMLAWPQAMASSLAVSAATA
jgi:hypothetical protein